MRRHVIIGASAAGLAAAEVIRARAPESLITLISDEGHRPYSRSLLTYLLSGEVPVDQVWLRGPDYFQKWGLEAILGDKVIQVDPAAREVRLGSGRVMTYDGLIIASGARPRLPGIPGEDLPMVFTLRTLADWRRLDACLPEAGTATVVGAGAVGLKAAEALVRRGLTVNLLEMGPHPLPHLLDPTSARLLNDAVASWGVRLHCRTCPLAVVADRGRVKGLALDDNREIPTDAVILAVGVAPNTDFLTGAGLAEPGGVVVDEYLATPDPHIYAAGDCILPHRLLTGRREAYQIWPAAVDQGRIAGINLTGGRTPYRGLLPQNSLSLQGFHLITGGLGPQETGDCEVWEELDERRGRYRRLTFRDDRLVGVTLAGDIEDAGIYFAVMAQQLPLSRLPADPRRRDFHPGKLWG
ncbi:MAG: NAD(P)/FAD-dependent oxidoreductase [Deltaproteobacteria bacterium]|nr:NAD(P)/FAD-dependent oxidoreductase [Deltaproteobacteria bacterium]